MQATFAFYCVVGIANALTLKNEPGWPLPVLKPTTHSYLSTNAEATAKFMLTYFANTVLLSDESVSTSDKLIRVIRYCAREQCMRMRFVEDKTAPVESEDFVKNSDDVMSQVGASATKQHATTYSPWIDIHDGIMADGFKIDLAIKDKLQFQKYSMKGPVRINLPYTIFTLELVCCYDAEDDAKLSEYAGIPVQPEKCRTNRNCADNVEPAVTPLTWYKVTYAAPDPVAAADFAVHALGAYRKVNPFEPGMGPQCTSAEWVVIPDRDYGLTEEQAAKPSDPISDCTIATKDGTPIKGLSLHFVKNPSFPQGNKTTDELAKQQGKYLDLYKQTHVEVEAESLDPFVARFKKLGLSYIARKEQDSFAVYVDEPKNGLVFKITSTRAPTLVQAQLAKIDDQTRGSPYIF
jgi:hypothetical protein